MQVETDFLMTLLKQQAPNYPNLRLVRYYCIVQNIVCVFVAFLPCVCRLCCDSRGLIFYRWNCHKYLIFIRMTCCTLVLAHMYLQILMSATMQEGMFSEYFAQCPVIYVSGRTFPVHQHYMQDIHTLVAQGQHMLATERGKVSNYSYSKAGNRGNSASSTAGDDNIVHGYDAMSGENRNSSKGGYKGKHPRLGKIECILVVRCHARVVPEFEMWNVSIAICWCRCGELLLIV